MAKLADIATRISSKNAGPFWVTIDVFCGSAEAYATVVARLDTSRLALLLGTPEQLIKRFDIADLNVVKISLPRPIVQGSRWDRDMHGAQLATLLQEFEIDDAPASSGG